MPSKEEASNSDFSYINFVRNLSEKGETLRVVSEQILSSVREGKVKIAHNSGVSMSTVSLPVNGLSTIFLPNSYSEASAILEAPRILIDLMRSASLYPSNELPELEKRIREELRLTTH
jgi:hypothetical protein